jgi:hypothetical protein
MYTANVGKYRPERNDILCYTDDIMSNCHFSSRLYKTLSHVYDPVEYSVYVDADIYLPSGFDKKLIEELKESGKLVGVFKHPWRDCVYEEAKEVIHRGKDTPINVDKAVESLKSLGYGKRLGLGTCGIVVRKNCIETAILNAEWLKWILSTSRRDQISFPYVFRGNIHYYEGDIYKYKRWRK